MTSSIVAAFILSMAFLLGFMMVAYHFLDTYFPTGYCRIVKPRKSKPTLPLHSSFASRVRAYRVLASFSSHPTPLSHSWIVSLHRWMPSHVLWKTTKSSAYRMQRVFWEIRRDCSESTGLPPEAVYRKVRVRTFEPGGQHDVRSRCVPTRPKRRDHSLRRPATARDRPLQSQ